MRQRSRSYPVTPTPWARPVIGAPPADLRASGRRAPTGGPGYSRAPSSATGAGRVADQVVIALVIPVAARVSALSPAMRGQGGTSVADPVTAFVVPSTAVKVPAIATPPRSRPDTVTAEDSSSAARITWPRVRP